MKFLKIFFLTVFLTTLFQNGACAREEKSPALSCVLSLIIPGVGQYYNGTSNEVQKGILQELGVLVGVGLCGAGYAVGHSEGYGTGDSLFLSGVGLVFGSWIWSVVDAPISSDDINREIAQNKHATSGIRINLTLLNDSKFQVIPGADMSLRF